MQLKDFVGAMLKEIINGVVDAQTYYAEKGRSVASGIGYAVASSGRQFRGHNEVSRISPEEES
jgi:hypothetical protein